MTKGVHVPFEKCYKEGTNVEHGGHLMISTREFTVVPVHVDNPERLLPHLSGSVQVVRAPCVQAVVHAATLAVRSFKRNTNHAKTPGGELLLRLAGTLQIREAIKTNGVGKGLNYLVIFQNQPEVDNILRELQLKTRNPENCEEETMKMLFEKSALVEVL